MSFSIKSMDLYLTDAIVIPPLQLKVDSGSYTCSGSGLLKDGYKFDPHFHRFLSPLEPRLSAEGIEPKIQEKPLAYWKAQCVFRNLMEQCTIEQLEIEDLQQWLRNGKAGMDSELRKVEEELNEEFWTKNTMANDMMWDSLPDDDAKAFANADRFLSEKFQNASWNDVVLLKLRKEVRLRIHRAAFPLGLWVEFAKAPLNSIGWGPDFDIWTVVGRNQSAVREEARRLCREAIRTRQLLLDANEEQTRSLHDAVVISSLAERDSMPQRFWDVNGLWAIRCPSIEDSLDKIDRCSLEIKFAGKENNGAQMWAKFNFITIKGVFLFTGPRRSDNDEECSDEDADSDTGFYFIDRPSPSFPKGNYRWRSEETSEGKVSHSNENLGSITFSGIGGTELAGVLSYKDNRREIRFTGMKIGRSPRFPTGEHHMMNFEWDKLKKT